MRLVLVHGINQQGKSTEDIQKSWVDDLEIGLGRTGRLSGTLVSAPFYGDELFVRSRARGGGAVAQGPEPQQDQDFAEFLSEAFEEQIERAGITRQLVNEEQRSHESSATAAVQQGFPMDRRINAMFRLLERASPFQGTLLLRLLDQAYAYLKRPGVGYAIDAIVEPALQPMPVVIVAHSLGTVVVFKLLRALANRGTPPAVPLLVTVGSPLPLRAVQKAIGLPFSRPNGVSRWINALDPDDFITLGRPLDRTNFCDKIENIADLRNCGKDAHAIPGYLSDRRIAQALASTLGI